MEFSASTYRNLVTESPAGRERLIRTYASDRADFDVIIVGSGVGGGVLADDLGDRRGGDRRILVIETARSSTPPTSTTFADSSTPPWPATLAATRSPRTATRHGFLDRGEAELNLGGRSILWSGLIPEIQDWELEFFPQRVRDDIRAGLIHRAGEAMNQSRSMGATARAVVERLRNSPPLS